MKRDWFWTEGDTKIVRSIARTAPGCHEGCGVLLYVKDDKLLKVEGDPEYPINQGRLCPRCICLPEVVYHPDRLTYPLRRVGKRGEGKWERIEWEEAFDTIADRMAELREQCGPQSMVFCQGTGRDIMPYISRLAYSYGSPNIITFGPLHGNACWWPKVIGMKSILGAYAVADCAQSFPDGFNNKGWRVPGCLVIWGNDPVVSNPDSFMGYWIVECMKRGTKLIVIDPRKTWLASRAKIWIQVRPGTDSALALGMLNVIINEGLYDKEFVEKWTHGFDELKIRVQDFPLDKVSEITWVPREQIAEVARVYAKDKPAAVQWGVALDQTKECVPTLHAIMALWALTGNIEVPGGNVFSRELYGMDQQFHWGYELMSREQWDKKSGKGMYPLLDLHPYFPGPGEAMIEQMLQGEPYPIKGSWIQSTNTIACGAADPKRTYQAFKKMELNVVVDLFVTPTAAAFADFILPAATYAEKDGIAIPIGMSTFVGTINKAIEPVGECKSDLEIDYEVGRRLNPDAWPWTGILEVLNVLAKPTGMKFSELREKGFASDSFVYGKHEKGLLRPDGKPGFNTQTGKVELYSTVFEKCGLDPLPYFEEPPESPATSEIAQSYPLILITGPRVRGFFHSEHRQIPSLRKMNPDPLTEIHPETAHSLGIRDGDWIWIENKHGKCRQRARLTDRIHPRMVSAQHGWWFPEMDGREPYLFGVWKSNVNLLLPSGWTGKSGLGYPFKTQMCKIYKAENA